ncbi:hypothetical protein B0H19DRAFT_1117939 [Mycena capillaripes]|nr:hypothetical protein B0H19DRAFT_1117939 [Mycena capillaripes]
MMASHHFLPKVPALVLAIALRAVTTLHLIGSDTITHTALITHIAFSITVTYVRASLSGCL